MWGSVVLSAVVAAVGAPSAPLAVHQEPLIRHLLLPGERVEIGYAVDTPGVTAPTGTLLVANDVRPQYVRVPMKLGSFTGPRGRQPRLFAVVPSRLVRGQRLLYYVVVRDPDSGRAVTVPLGGGNRPETASVLDKPFVVRLGVHRFGRTRAPEAVVARAGPAQVGFRTQGDVAGPQTFVVGRDRSIWLDDGLKQRLLVWRAGDPATIARTVRLPHFSPDTDFALGAHGTLYDAWWDAGVLRFDRLTGTGKVLWQSTLTSEVTNTELRIGPLGTLYAVVGRPGSLGAERGWTPAATPAGVPYTLVEQRRRDGWPYQPLPNNGERLLAVLRPPNEMRYAIVDRDGRPIRAWRILSGTRIAPNATTPELVGKDLVVVLDVTAQVKGPFRWEYLVLRLGPSGKPRAELSLRRAVYGDNLLADVRIGPDGKLYELGSSPATGVRIYRFSLR
jgi:hypothetical protein